MHSSFPSPGSRIRDRFRDRFRDRLRPFDGGPWPVYALAFTAALGLVQSVQLLAPLCWPALVLLAYAAGRRMRSPVPMVWFFGALAAAGLPLCAVVGRELWGWPTLLVTALLTMGLPWLVGRYRRQRAELTSAGWRIADRLEREQRAVADRARIRERARIAGDMHDSLGHDLALLAVRAGALELDPGLDPRRQAAAGELREGAAAATERLQEIIGVLRTDSDPDEPCGTYGTHGTHEPYGTYETDEPDEPRPMELAAPGAPTAPAGESVEALTERARSSGIPVVLEQEGEQEGDPSVAALPTMVALAVHRVVQEGLTNAAKHAPDAEVRVRLVREGDTVLAVVRNGPPPTAAPGPRLASGGTGLVGLDERVRLAGGTLRHGATSDGGFELTAELPAQWPTHGAAPRAPGATAPTVSARELERARRQVRRRLRQAVLVPLAAFAGILVLMLPVSLVSSAMSILGRDDYARLEPGDPRGEVEKVLPAFARDGAPDDAPRPPRGQDCAYYSTGLNSADAYRLCFEAARLASKERVGGGP